jgi:hypothetical protein
MSSTTLRVDYFTGLDLGQARDFTALAVLSSPTDESLPALGASLYRQLAAAASWSGKYGRIGSTLKK